MTEHFQAVRDAVTAFRQEQLDPGLAAWVVDQVAGGLGADVRRWLTDGDDALTIGTRLARRGVRVDRRTALLDVVAGSTRAHGDGHPPDTMWTSAAAEQASHPLLAAWRAARFRDALVVDVTAGCGGDAIALTSEADTTVAAERHRGRLALLAWNMRDRGLVIAADALRGAVVPRAFVWADPGRRTEGRRARRLADTDPPVPALVGAHERSPGLGIAVSPGVDLTDPDLPYGELEFVQVEGRLVEATLWGGALAERGPGPRAPRSATLLPTGEHVRGTPGPPCAVGSMDEVLLEPASALVRARLHDAVAADVGARRVDQRRALFTTSQVPSSPWFRAWRVEEICPARPRAVRAALRRLPALPLEVALHGVDADVQRWIRDLGRPPTGPRGRRLHLVRTDSGAVAVLTVAAPPSP